MGVGIGWGGLFIFITLPRNEKQATCSIQSVNYYVLN
jgi:hypothetical protein